MSDEAYLQLKETILGYVADKLRVERVNQDWRREINTQLIPRPVSNHIQRCIELANQGLYAPESDMPIKALVDRVAKILTDVDSIWKTS
jgi:hypothetical protein